MLLTCYRLVAGQVGAAIEGEEPEHLWLRPILGVELRRCHSMLLLLLLLVLIGSNHCFYLIVAASSVCLFKVLQLI